MLGADGEADGTLVDALVGEFGLRQLGVGGCGGMDDQRLDVGNIGQQREDLQGVYEAERFLLASLDLEGENGAAPVGEIPEVLRVVGMGGECRMVDLSHLGVFGQEVHHLQGVGHVALDAQRECLQALKENETADRRERRAGVPQQDGPGPGDVSGRADRVCEHDPVITVVGLCELGEFAGGLPVELPGIDDDASDGRAVTADEFGRGMHDDVSPVLDRPQKVRRRESIVGDQRNPVRMGNLRNGFYINKIGIRIAETLNEEGLGLGTDRLLEIGQVSGVYESRGDPVRNQSVLKQVVRASVDVLGGNDVVSCTCDIEYRVGDGCGAGGHGQGADAPFERSDALLEDVLRRIGQTAIDVARIGQTEARRGVLRIVEHIGTGLVDGDGAGVGCGIGLLLAYVKLKGFEMKFTCAHGMFVLICFPIAKLDVAEKTNKKNGKIW